MPSSPDILPTKGRSLIPSYANEAVETIHPEEKDSTAAALGVVAVGLLTAACCPEKATPIPPSLVPPSTETPAPSDTPAPSETPLPTATEVLSSKETLEEKYGVKVTSEEGEWWAVGGPEASTLLSKYEVAQLDLEQIEQALLDIAEGETAAGSTRLKRGAEVTVFTMKDTKGNETVTSLMPKEGEEAAPRLIVFPASFKKDGKEFNLVDPETGRYEAEDGSVETIAPEIEVPDAWHPQAAVLLKIQEEDGTVVFRVLLTGIKEQSDKPYLGTKTHGPQGLEPTAVPPTITPTEVVLPTDKPTATPEEEPIVFDLPAGTGIIMYNKEGDSWVEAGSLQVAISGIKVVGEEGDYLLIELPSGRQGWVLKDSVDDYFPGAPTEPAPTGEAPKVTVVPPTPEPGGFNPEDRVHDIWGPPELRHFGWPSQPRIGFTAAFDEKCPHLDTYGLVDIRGQWNGASGQDIILNGQAFDAAGASWYVLQPDKSYIPISPELGRSLLSAKEQAWVVVKRQGACTGNEADPNMQTGAKAENFLVDLFALEPKPGLHGVIIVNDPAQKFPGLD